MQTTLIQRYLGNKTTIADDIVGIVRGLADPGDLVFDAFSGSLAVSTALRASGFEVACNDINHFSWLFAKAYFSTGSMPAPYGQEASEELNEKLWAEVLEELTAPYGRDIPKRSQRSDIFDHYCEEGSKSAFNSRRGTSGNRRFFSPENAILIDRALSRIRHRYRSGQLDEITRCILTSALISSVEKVSNTQGTYHDFPRTFVDERALKQIALRVPSAEVFRGPVSRHIGREEDSLDFALRVPRHRVTYIDPPYNFRQYTSYYFMLNLLSSHAEIDEIDAYFDAIEFVRGQNMKSDFKSSFCSKSEFLPSLEKLVRRANSDFVVLSYFDGRNHWGEFKSDLAEKEGRSLIEGFFSTDLFVAGSLKCIPIARTNYQSYGGYNAKPIQEFLFVAERRRSPEVVSDLGRSAWTGQVLA